MWALGKLDDQSVGSGTPSALRSECRTGADANARQDCRIVGDVNSVQTLLDGRVRSERRATRRRRPSSSPARPTPAAAPRLDRVGPFYCPVDKHVYIDLGFFDELRDAVRATGGPFAEAYVLAHEYGHHVQDLLGTLGRRRTQQGPAERFGADRAAGRLLRRRLGPPRRRDRLHRGLTQADINDALDAAAAVGDDRIQSETQGQVNPETWTHGSSAQRQHWFAVGYKSVRGPVSCTTFAVAVSG